MMKHHIKQYLQQLGVSAEVEEIPLLPIPFSLTKADSTSNPYKGFNKAANLILNLEVAGHHEVSYVLGYSYRYKTFEHTIIKVNGFYFDPVYQDDMEFKGSFIKVWEVSANELFDYVDEHCRPPTLYDWLELKSRAVLSKAV